LESFPAVINSTAHAPYMVIARIIFASNL
jgi:hypothetical protein